MKFSQRTNWPSDSNPLTQRIEEKKAAGEKLIDLTESNPTRCGFRFLESSWLKPFDDPKNISYEPNPHGLLEARKAVCAYYAEKKIKIGPEQVFLTSSTSEAYTFIFRLLCDARDLVVVPRPSYPLLDYLTALADVDTLRYFLSYEKTWQISTDSLEIPFIEKPKALVLVNPNNPTGNFVKPDELSAVNTLCQRSETAIISDEVFLDFVWDARKTKAMSLADNREVLTFTLSGVAKILALPQMKLSWIVVNGPMELREKAIARLEIIADTYLSVNTPSQRALGDWLQNRELVRHELLERVKSNRQILETNLKGRHEFELLPCEGGWVSILNIQSEKSDEELTMALLEEHNLVTHPGYFFDFSKGEFLVLSLLLPTEVFREGVERLLKSLR